MNKPTSKRLKRLISLALSAVLLLSVMTACGSKPAEEPGAESSAADYPFYNPLTEPADIGDSTVPVEPDEEIVAKIENVALENPDARGWLHVPNTQIDDVIVQGPDNKKYLRADNYGKYAWEGCYYVDYRNVLKDRASLGKNTIIYGHNLNDDKENGVRFAQLMRFVDLDFAQKTPYFYVSTPTDDMVFKIFASFYTGVNFYYIETKFPDNASFLSLANDAKARSEHLYDVDLLPTDKIMTLSTCTYKFGGLANPDQRFVVMGRLLRPDEKDTDAVTITKNPTPKQPTF